MPPPLRHRFSKYLAAWPWRRVGVLAGISLGLALMLVAYLFGIGDHFFSRLFSAFLVLFWLLSVMFLAVVPFVAWATAHWFGPGWAEASMPVARPRRTAAGRAGPGAGSDSVLSPASSRRPHTR